jgi:hypothetical protein
LHAVGRTRYNGLQVHEQHAMAIAAGEHGGGAKPTVRTTDGVTANESDHYYDRKLGGKCTYSTRCRRPLADGSQLCDRHLRKERRRVSVANKKARVNNRSLGMCAFCPTKSGTYRCPACAIKHGQSPTVRTADGVTATAPDPWRRDKDGWERYRGKGKRGAPPAALNDEADLRRAFESLERGRNAIAYARSAAVAELPRIQKQDALAAATSILAMSAQFTWSVVERNRVPDPRVVGARAQVREALGAGVDPEMLDDALIDRVIAAVRRAA